MRLRRLSFIAGWAAVALLAVAGFAAFGTSGSTQADPGFDAATASLGHDIGANAGINFALLAAEPASAESDTETLAATEDPASDQTDNAANGETSPGTIAPSGWLSQVQVRSLVAEYFSAEDVNRAVRVAWCESRFDPNSTNLRTGAVGLFQHLPRYWAERAANAGFEGAEPTDPEASTAAAAWAVYDGGGWDVFACRG
ncbi:MAG TPA: transglycosylase SLT domain-containing protein [Acidimicrobiia bacterium]